MAQWAVAVPHTGLSRNKWTLGVVADTQSPSRSSLARQKVPGQPELYNPCLGLCVGGGRIKKIIKDQKETRTRHKRFCHVQLWKVRNRPFCIIKKGTHKTERHPFTHKNSYHLPLRGPEKEVNLVNSHTNSLNTERAPKPCSSCWVFAGWTLAGFIVFSEDKKDDTFHGCFRKQLINAIHSPG